jgi:putative GTP pyrophosphokinase
MARVRWQDEYLREQPGYDRLRQEAEYALGSRLGARRIKLHTLTSRVKTLASLEEKAQRKVYKRPLLETPDLVGVRVVVLFLSDIARVDDIVSSLFEVVGVSDTVEGTDDPSTFGYMSKHFDARLPSTLKGPRYEDLPGIRFEVQVRTLLMDAWANVSHYLAYKGESSIPPELRGDFNALSGLFYVADKHFELFFGRTETVREKAEEQLDTATELYPKVVDAFEKEGGVPSRLLKTDRRKAGKEGTPCRMFARSPSGRAARRSRSRSMSWRGREHGG